MLFFFFIAFGGGVSGQEVETRFFRQYMSWNAARDHCRSFGGELAKSSDVMRNDELLDLFRSSSNGQVMWLGASDRNAEDEWEWLADRSDFSSYTNWCGWVPFWGSQPNGGEWQNCLGMTRNGCWNDIECAVRAPFACQFGDGEEVSNYCQAFGKDEDEWDGDRAAYPGGDCSQALNEFDGTWAGCCCENDGCCPDGLGESCEAVQDDDDQGSESPFFSHSNRSCLVASNVLESFETCKSIEYSSPNDEESVRSECWASCEDTYAYPLAASYGSGESGECCCVSHCLCYEDNEGYALAISVGESGAFNDGTEVQTCDAVLDELRELIPSEDDDLDSILDNYFTLDDLDDHCVPSACLELGVSDDDCCALAAESGCTSGYVKIDNSRETCYPSIGGDSARQATCCVDIDSDAAEGLDDDEDRVEIPSDGVFSSTLFLIDPGSAVTWNENVEYCRARGLETVSLADESDDADLVRLIAANDADQVWLGAEIRRRLWVWHDGSLADYLRSRLAGSEVTAASARIQVDAEGEWNIVDDDDLGHPACRFGTQQTSSTRASSSKKKKNDDTAIVVVLGVLCALFLVVIAVLCCCMFQRNRGAYAATQSNDVIVADSVELMPSKF